MFKLSASKLRTFKACRRKYQLSYIELLEPIQKEQALEMGSSYHKNIEMLLNKEDVIEIFDDVEQCKILAMTKAFQKYILPKLPKVKATEQKFEFCIDEEKDYWVNGIIDAITEDGLVIEHKTSSTPLDEKYIDRINWDDQVPIYMLATGTNNCCYTVCQKPTIRLKKDEELVDFYKRCLDWYEENTEQKIGLFIVVRTKEELAEKWQELKEMCEEMENAKVFYKNQQNCSIISCPYSSICLNYDASIEPIGFKKKEENI